MGMGTFISFRSKKQIGIKRNRNVEIGILFGLQNEIKQRRFGIGSW